MMRWRTRLRGRPDRGAAAVEFAIVLSVLLIIIFGIIDFGRLLFAVQGAKAASREAARVAIIRNTAAATIATTAKTAADSARALSGAKPEEVTVTTSIPTCSSAGAQMKVTVSFPFSWFTPVGTFASAINTVSSSTTMRCE